MRDTLYTPSQIQNRYTMFDNSSPTSIARRAFPKSVVLRAKEKAKCESCSEIARSQTEIEKREGGRYRRERRKAGISRVRMCVCICICVERRARVEPAGEGNGRGEWGAY